MTSLSLMILYSNEVIYEAFSEMKKLMLSYYMNRKKEFQSIDVRKIEGNYFLKTLEISSLVLIILK